MKCIVVEGCGPCNLKGSRDRIFCRCWALPLFLMNRRKNSLAVKVSESVKHLHFYFFIV